MTTMSLGQGGWKHLPGDKRKKRLERDFFNFIIFAV